MMADFLAGDPALCWCCGLPTCMGETSGLGKVCAGCTDHGYDQLGSELTTDSDEIFRRDAEHEMFEEMLQAAHDYFARNGINGRPPRVTPPAWPAVMHTPPFGLPVTTTNAATVIVTTDTRTSP